MTYLSMEKNIEVELRSFITKEKFEELLKFFSENSKLTKKDYQETFYFDHKEDLRIQKNNSYSKIWLKKGKLHDDAREEIEIKFNKEEFEKLEKLFNALGNNVKIKWFRERNQFDWNGIKVCLDYTKGYGHIIELERLSNEHEKLKNIELLKQKFKELDLEITPKEEFENKFNYYEKNWKTLTRSE